LMPRINEFESKVSSTHRLDRADASPVGMGPQPRTILPRSRGVSMATVENT
jgi:hypothetical protein